MAPAAAADPGDPGAPAAAGANSPDSAGADARSELESGLFERGPDRPGRSSGRRRGDLPHPVTT